MFDVETMRQLSDMLDEKFEVNNAKLKTELKEELKAELKKELGDEFNAALKSEIGGVRKELRALKDDVVDLRSEMREVKADMRDVKGELRELKETSRILTSDVEALKSVMENEIRPNINLLAENYAPAAKRFTKEADKIEALRMDMDIVKKTVEKHSGWWKELQAAT